MAQFRRLVARVISLFRSSRDEAELAREMDAHLQLLQDQFVARGMSAVEARYAARRAFGGLEQAKERQRDARSFRWLAGWSMDLKLGVRMLVKSPGLTVVAGLALAIAIGAGAAYLEFTRDALYPTLPAPDGDRIVGITIRDIERSVAVPRVMADFVRWRATATTIEELGAARRVEGRLVTPDGRTDPPRAVQISAGAFQIMATPALIGRSLAADDERSDAPPVVVIGHDLWQARFGADPSVIGRTVRFESTVYTIVGVMPEGYSFPQNHNLWMPLEVRSELQRGAGPWLQMFARLKPGATLATAQAELQSLLGTAPALRAEVQLYLDSILSNDRQSSEVRLLHAANVIFVLLLALCGANVATLVFARTAMRESEITVRTALGASRARITAQLFAEALVLSCVGAVAGLLVARYIGAWLTLKVVEASGAPRPFWWNENLSVETVLYAALLAVLSAVVVGVTPALKATGKDLQGRLRDASGGSRMQFGKLWTGIIVAQTGITVIFLAAAAAIAMDLVRESYAPSVTYPRENILLTQLSDTQSAGSYGRPLRRDESLRVLIERLRAEPGVTAVTYATALPGATFQRLGIELLPAGAHAVDTRWTSSARVGPGFFELAGVGVVAGRVFSESEMHGGLPVAIVDESFARRHLGQQNPIGMLLREAAVDSRAQPGPWREIVGVVRDVRRRPATAWEHAVLYLPAPASTPATRLLVRTQGPASAFIDRVQTVALEATPSLRLDDPIAADRLEEESRLPERMVLRAVAVSAGVAMLLSMAGIYALTSFTLSRRTREIGIRVALGAAPRRIITNIFSRTFTQVSLGALAGAVPAAAVVIMLHGDSGPGPILAGSVAFAVAVLVLCVAIVSCVVPLRRALRVDPMQALRTDT
jgi:predicted permease